MAPERLPTGLLLITDRTQARHPLETVCRAALETGFTGIMVREKDLGARELLTLSLPIADLCRAFSCPILINDRFDVALAIPHAGAHTGARGIAVCEARQILGPDRLLGYSAHEIPEAARAFDDGADYVTLSPVFESESKPGQEGRGPDFLSRGTAELPAGVLALGGVDAGNLQIVRSTGVRGAAVMGAMMRAEDPRATGRALMNAWNAGPDSTG